MKLTLAISALVLLGACEGDALRGHPLPQCGHESNGAFIGFTEFPATNEGNGWVGLMGTSWSDSGSGSQHFDLLQCKSGAVVQGSYSTQMFIETVSTDRPRPEDSLIAFIENYSFDWEQGTVETALKFLDDLKVAQYYGVVVRQEYANGDSERESCACDLYYPRVRQNWPDRPQERLNYEQRFEEIIARLSQDE